MLPATFNATLAGTVAEGQDANGLIDVHLDSTLRGGIRGQLKLVLQGVPLDDGGVSMTASGVDFAAPGTSLYQGQIVALNGNRVTARVSRRRGTHPHARARPPALAELECAQRDAPREPGMSVGSTELIRSGGAGFAGAGAGFRGRPKVAL